MSIVVPPVAAVLNLGVDAVAAAQALAAAADERHVLCSLIAAGTASVTAIDGGRVELRVRIDVDTLQALEDATETALPEPVAVPA